MARHRWRTVAGLMLAALAASADGCGRESTQAPASVGTAAAPRPSILLVTLDTTRADAIGPDAKGITTASFNAVAARGRLFQQAYATVPETLPSHASLMTGLYPAGHGLHENARHLPEATPVLAERLRERVTGPPPTCRASCWPSGSGWTGDSTFTTTSWPWAARIAPPRK